MKNREALQTMIRYVQREAAENNYNFTSHLLNLAALSLNRTFPRGENIDISSDLTSADENDLARYAALLVNDEKILQ
ncbi:hypothetical protein [Hartmannibacter diazotrophicus]|uniref:hypothetical protein n=1 Tax=Hartmannibacter diazotrophicus TaxID=1482074 RepID=UPI001AECB20E|nr:hypothetical protein [Hartmannibacter diazotrophicus]